VGTTVFINYRDGDGDMCAALIYQFLSARLGAAGVFLDHCSLAPGDDFEQVILRRLRGSSVLLTIIGPNWLAPTGSSGLRRIDSQRDWVRRELAEAFRLGLRVVPVLTDGATLPAVAALPADIAGLSRRQYVALRRRQTMEDLAQLLTRLTQLEPRLVTHRTARGALPRHGRPGRAVLVVPRPAGRGRPALPHAGQPPGPDR
jgi:hypothetical protein